MIGVPKVFVFCYGRKGDAGQRVPFGRALHVYTVHVGSWSMVFIGSRSALGAPVLFLLIHQVQVVGGRSGGKYGRC